MQDSLSSPTSQQYLLDKKIESELPNTKKLTLLPLIFIIFFEIGGGPFGEENVVGGGGPLLAILGFIIFPFIYSIPVALITTELATTFPDNGGFVIWANEAFGPFWASLMGFWRFFSVVINMAALPVLCLDYLKSIIPALSFGLPRYLFMFFFPTVLSFFSYLGLSIVGYAIVAIGVISIMPFVLLTLIAFPKINPKRWVSLGQKGVKKDWRLYFNSLFWSFSYWDGVSTFVGETDQPQKTFPKALLIGGLLICVIYMIPLLPTIGAIPLNQRDWVDGYFANAAEIIAGKWLKLFMEISAFLTVIGTYIGQLSSVAYQLMGMADLGFLPPVFGQRSRKFNTPWLSILVSTIVVLSMSYLSFTNLISIVNFLYSLGLFVEIASYLQLRKKLPTLERPFKVPLRFPSLIIMCLMPLVLLVYAITTASKIVYLASAFITASAIVFYYFMNLSQSKKWIEFNREGV